MSQSVSAPEEDLVNSAVQIDQECLHFKQRLWQVAWKVADGHDRRKEAGCDLTGVNFDEIVLLACQQEDDAASIRIMLQYPLGDGEHRDRVGDRQ